MNSSISTLSPEADDVESETPASRRRRKVRDSIIEAAERVFAEEGLEGLSIRRLADEIDYSPSAIYKYFTSKTELVGCLKEAFFLRLVRNIEKVVEGNEGCTDWRVVRDCVKTYVHTALEKPHHYVARFTRSDDDGAEGHVQDNPYVGDSPSAVTFQFLYEGIEEGVQSGNFRPDLNTQLASKSIATAMHGLTVCLINMPDFLLLQPDGSQMSPDDFIDFYADQLVRGLEAGK